MFPFLIRPAEQAEWDSVFIEESTSLNQKLDRSGKQKFFSGNQIKNMDGSHASSVHLFEFDPNTAMADDWKKLGVQESVVHRVLKYRERGGRFREANDLKKIYGLPESTCNQLMPYVRIASSSGFQNMKTQQEVISRSIAIDINAAKEDEWKKLPGIGPGYARRIVNFREKLGGFYKIEQVAETYGLPDSLFKSIRNKLIFTGELYRFIDLNAATYEELTAHPYIDYRTAKLIVSYRREHGPFQSKEEMLKIVTIDSFKYDRVAPYIKIK